MEDSSNVTSGKSADITPGQRAKIKVSNVIGVLLVVLGLIYAALSYFINPWLSIYPLSAAIIGFSVPFLNRARAFTLSRVLISVVPISLDALFHGFLTNASIPFIIPLYFSQVAFALIPWMVFDQKELKWLLGTASFTMMVLVLQSNINAALEMNLAFDLFSFTLVRWATYLAAATIFFVCLWTLLSATRAKEGELRQANQALADSIKELGETQSQLVLTEKMATLGTLIAGIAHEVKNPLNFIAGGNRGLKDLLPQIEHPKRNELVEYMEIIDVGVERLTGVINGLNLMNREGASFDEECDLHQILNNCLLILKGKINENVTVKKSFYPEELVVRGNVGKLHQVVLNLLDNAIHAVNGRGQITITTKLIEQRATVLIQDNGPGMNNWELDLIKQPFYTTKAPGKGTGLGLSISDDIMKSHGGTLSINSKIGHGTTVEMKFPTDRLIQAS